MGRGELNQAVGRNRNRERELGCDWDDMGFWDAILELGLARLWRRSRKVVRRETRPNFERGGVIFWVRLALEDGESVIQF